MKKCWTNLKFFPKEMPSSEVVFTPPKADSHAMAPHAHAMTISKDYNSI